MANEEHLKLLLESVDEWNSWRLGNLDVIPDLSVADLDGKDFTKANQKSLSIHEAPPVGRVRLHGADLRWAKLAGANLARALLYSADLERARLVGTNLDKADIRGAKLIDANLHRASLLGASLFKANLSGAYLAGANLRGACLAGANLERTKLQGTNLAGANLAGANLNDAHLVQTVFADVDLTKTSGLDSCIHWGPSVVDHCTLAKSKNVPIEFWRDCGLPDRVIDYMPSLTSDAIQFYSCFISYSSKDKEFADRLHADLQNAGVRCWFAPHDMRTGDRIKDTIDEQIRFHEKLLLILSDSSVSSAWVAHEVDMALKEEQESNRLLLFPIRLDDAVISTTDQWAHDIKRTRHITNFSNWKDYDSYKTAFDRILQDLKPQ